MLAAWWVIPRPVTDQLRAQTVIAVLPLVLGEQERGGYTARLRASIDTSLLQVEWIAKKKLTTPSALIYAGGLFLGRIGPQGVYRFSFKRPLPLVPNRIPITLYDIIHHRTIDEINF